MTKEEMERQLRLMHESLGKVFASLGAVIDESKKLDREMHNKIDALDERVARLEAYLQPKTKTLN